MANRNVRRVVEALTSARMKKIGMITLHTLKWLSIIGLVAGFLAAGAAFGYISSLVNEDPVRSREAIVQQMQQNTETGFVHFSDDSVIGQLRTEEDRRLATKQEIPQKMVDATLAIEDAHFYQHNGIRFQSLFRAVSQKVAKSDVQTGGSTITQQLARRVFLSLDREVSRKAKEIFLSMRIERLMSKDEILLAYLNKIPYGNGSTGYNLYGIKAAAKGIFGVDDLYALSIAQCAYLAGLPQQPSNYSAFTSAGQVDPTAFKRADVRKQLVLKRMLEENKITQDQYDEALQFDIRAALAQPEKKAYATYPYLMLETERQAAEILVNLQYPNLTLDTEGKKAAYKDALNDAKAQLLKSGYHIYTTIDKTVYDAMHEISENDKNFSPDHKEKGKEQIGAMMIDNKTGAIIGMIEGRGFKSNQYNHATQSTRQPGSTMKPIAAYLPAIEKGVIQPGSVIDDAPIVLPDGQKGFHIPKNWNTHYSGLVTARTALNKSLNLPALKVYLNLVGIQDAWTFAKKLGITSIVERDYQAQTGVIGGMTYGVSVQDLTGAYSAIGNKGVFNKTFMIRKIVDSEGKTVYEHEAKPETVFSGETAYLMTDMLRTVIDSPEGTAGDLKTKFKPYGKVPIVGKTGSTQDDGDAWFEGLTPDVTLGVWAGYEESQYKLSTPGKSRAKNIWALVMNAVAEKKPDLLKTPSFERPADIVEMTVSSVSGKLPSELITSAGKLTTDIFNKKFIPTVEDDVMVNTKYVSYAGVNYLPKPDTPEDMLQQSVMIRREKPVSELLNEIREAQAKMPEKDREPLETYIPADAGQDAPSQLDPRTDDGQPPESPGGVSVSIGGDGLHITFTASPSADVVGYRLYRSELLGGYQRVEGKVVLPGQDMSFTEPYALRSFYVAAVDVAGRESTPTRAVLSDGSAQQLDGASATDPSQAGARPPSAPQGLKAKPTALSLELNWQANDAAQKVTQYIVYYSEKKDGKYRKLGSTTGTTAFSYYAVYFDGFYKVSAVNDQGESQPGGPIEYKSS